MSAEDSKTTSEDVKKKPGWRITVLRIAALFFVLALSVGLFLYRHQIAIWIKEIPSLNYFAYPAIFLLSILANATIILPIPGVALATLLGPVFNPILVAVAAGAGAAIGELTGYLAGFSGRGVVENRKWYDRVVKWMRKYGDLTILVMAIIPNPFFDVAGMVAGAMKMPWWRFIFWCMIGKIIKMLLFAYGGFALGKYLGF